MVALSWIANILTSNACGMLRKSRNYKESFLVIIVKKAIDLAHQLLLHFMTLLKCYPISYLAVFDGLFLMLYHLSSKWEFEVLMVMGLIIDCP